MLYIHTSNRLENLIQAFATILKEQPLPPLKQEIIVVQSQGMERWISMSFAEQLGVWANSTFPFPYKIVWQLFKDALRPLKLADVSPFEPEVMVWSLMDILPQLFAKQALTELNRYLQEDEQDIKRYQLAWRIAEVFDQYVVYRPDWLAHWENDTQPLELKNDPQAVWQARLWQALIKRHGTQHRAQLRTNFLNHIHKLENNLRFQRISVFGISALPPFHLEVLAKLGQVIEVHLFFINPCQEAWGHIISESEMARKVTKVKDQTMTAEAQYYEKGNTLLASMGKMGRDFLDLLTEYPQFAQDYFDEPGQSTLLTTLQSDILNLQERSIEKPRVPLEMDDKSVQIHACHSPMREVEVLHDQLLALFEAHPKLSPKDVIVMMPDIETYAPFIEAVFATTTTKHIPFSLADRSLRGESALIGSFFAILELSNSRLSVNQVLAVLETEAVQKRFGFNEQDLDLIRVWLDQTGIRWGIDASDKERLNLPAFEENTWRAGLKRLLLGYALLKSPLVEAEKKEEKGKIGTSEIRPDFPNFEEAKQEVDEATDVSLLKNEGSKSKPEVVGGEYLFQNILPYDEIEGSDSLILGQLIEFIESLFKTVQELEQPRTLSDWTTFLTSILERFLSADDDETQHIQNVLNKLTFNSELANFTQTVNREVMLAYLRHHLEEQPQPTNFLTGKVLFCTMLPMRSIPFKVVCLLGMNDQAYPRPSKSIGFDLIAKHPQRGDRSRRQNDRYLFLESLLSARQYFYLSYLGHSIHDNTIMPPSVLVNELLDYIDKGFSYPSGPILDYLVTHHPLQAFSPRYFDTTNKHLFSFSSEYCVASTALLQERQQATAFIDTLLSPPQPEAEWKTVDLNRLIRFFSNPTEFLLRRRLGIELHSETNLLDESEPFDVRGLARYTLNQTLVEKSLDGIDLHEYQRIAKAMGQLPHGKIGDYAYSKLLGQIQPFVERVHHTITRQKKREAVQIKLSVGDMQITGHLGRLWHDNLVHYRLARLKATDFIQLWLHHLVLNSLALADQTLPRHSLLIGEKGSFEFQPVKNSLAILQTLLTDYYWQGLMQPLPFFPESSLMYAEQLHKNKTESDALFRAQTSWRGSDFGPGEAKNDYYQLCFAHQNDISPLENEQFKHLAKQFFEPLLAHLQAVE